MKTKREIFQSTITADYILEHPKKNNGHLYILLHGFMEDGPIIFNKLKDTLPKDSIILSPNGMYPIPQRTDSGYKLNFAWYFFDNVSGEYFIYYDQPADFLNNLIKKLNLDTCEKTIIGYSQGGYLAPFAAEKLSKVKQVVGLACNFKHEFIKASAPYPLIAIHGDNDLMVDFQNAKSSHEKLMAKGCHGAFYELTGEGHRLSKAFKDKLMETIA